MEVIEYKVKLSGDTSGIERALNDINAKTQKLSKDELLVKINYDGNFQEFYKIIQQVYKNAPEIGMKFQYDLNLKALEIEKKKLAQMMEFSDPTTLKNNISSGISEFFDLKKNKNAEQAQVVLERITEQFAYLMELSPKLANSFKGIEKNLLENLDTSKYEDITILSEAEINKQKAKVAEIESNILRLKEIVGTDFPAEKVVKVKLDTTDFYEEIDKAKQKLDSLTDKKISIGVNEDNTKSNLSNGVYEKLAYATSLQGVEYGSVGNSQTGYVSDIFSSGNRDGISVKLFEEIIRSTEEQIDTFIHSHPASFAAFSESDVQVLFNKFEEGIRKSIVVASNDIMSLDASALKEDQFDNILNDITRQFEESESKIDSLIASQLYDSFDKIILAIPQIGDQKLNSNILDQLNAIKGSFYDNVSNLSLDEYASILDEAVQQAALNSGYDKKKAFAIASQFDENIQKYLNELYQSWHQRILQDIFSNPNYLKEGYSSALSIEKINPQQDSSTFQQNVNIQSVTQTAQQELDANPLHFTFQLADGALDPIFADIQSAFSQEGFSIYLRLQEGTLREICDEIEGYLSQIQIGIDKEQLSSTVVSLESDAESFIADLQLKVNLLDPVKVPVEPDVSQESFIDSIWLKIYDAKPIEISVTGVPEPSFIDNIQSKLQGSSVGVKATAQESEPTDKIAKIYSEIEQRMSRIYEYKQMLATAGEKETKELRHQIGLLQGQVGTRKANLRAYDDKQLKKYSAEQEKIVELEEKINLQNIRNAEIRKNKVNYEQYIENLLHSIDALSTSISNVNGTIAQQTSSFIGLSNAIQQTIKSISAYNSSANKPQGNPTSNNTSSANEKWKATKENEKAAIAYTNLAAAKARYTNLSNNNNRTISEEKEFRRLSLEIDNARNRYGKYLAQANQKGSRESVDLFNKAKKDFDKDLLLQKSQQEIQSQQKEKATKENEDAAKAYMDLAAAKAEYEYLNNKQNRTTDEEKRFKKLSIEIENATNNYGKYLAVENQNGSKESVTQFQEAKKAFDQDLLLNKGRKEIEDEATKENEDAAKAYTKLAAAKAEYMILKTKGDRTTDEEERFKKLSIEIENATNNYGKYLAAANQAGSQESVKLFNDAKQAFDNNSLLSQGLNEWFDSFIKGNTYVKQTDDWIKQIQADIKGVNATNFDSIVAEIRAGIDAGSLNDEYKIVDSKLIDDEINKIDETLKTNMSITRNARKQYDLLRETLVSFKGTGTAKEFEKLKDSIRNLNMQTKISPLKTIEQGLGNIVNRYFGLHEIVQYIKNIVQTVTNLDSALTELRKVSDASTARLQETFRKSADTARELGSSISDVIKVTSDFSRLGFDVGQAEDLAKVTTLFENVGDNMSVDEASSYLISTLKGFQIEAEEASRIVDVYNEVAKLFGETHSNMWGCVPC